MGETAKSGFCGFGFATDEFSDYDRASGSNSASGFNYDEENYSRIIYYAGGQGSNSWGSKWKTSHLYFAQHASFKADDSKGFNVGDIVCVKLNMATKEGKVYNQAHPDEPAALIDLRLNEKYGEGIS